MRRLALLALLALPLAGCGAKDAIDPVAEAATKTGQESAEIRLSGNAMSIPISGQGVIDPANKKARITMEMAMPGMGRMQIEEVLDGLTMYMKLDGLGDRLPGGKPWIKLDLEKLGDAAGLDMQALMQGSGGDPTQYLQYLEAVKDSKQMGTERVNGVETTHWRATVDVGKLSKDLAKQAGVDTIPVDAWIDGDGRVRRQVMAWSQQQGSMAITVDFVRFGVPVEVTAPPAAQVTDMSALAGAALGGGAGAQP